MLDLTPNLEAGKFEFGMDALDRIRVDARAAVKIAEPYRGRKVLFFICLECGYYKFVKPEIAGILKKVIFYRTVNNNASNAFFCVVSWVLYVF